jgi:hypothetical protein
MTYQKCEKCGSEEFTADVFYHTQVKLSADETVQADAGWEQTLFRGDEEEELDLGSVQCLNCGEEKNLSIQ